MDVKPEELKQKVEELLTESAKAEQTVREERRGQAEELVVGAFQRAIRSGHRFVRATALFSALPFIEHELLKRVFTTFSIDPGDLDRALIFSSGRSRFFDIRRLPVSLGGFTLETHRPLRHRIMNRAWTARSTRILDKYSTDFTDLARQKAI